MNVQKSMKRYIEDHFLNQASIARAIDMDPASFNKILNGKRYIRGDELIAFCNAVGVSVDDIKNY